MLKIPSKTADVKPGRKKNLKTVLDKQARKRLEGELDNLWSKIIHKLWGEKCAWPGCEYTTRLASHHFYHKAHGLRARWNLDNGILLDFYHHIQRVLRQGDTEPIRDAIILRIGETRFFQMKSDVNCTWKPSIQELGELRRQFMRILSESSQMDADPSPFTLDDETVLKECF